MVPNRNQPHWNKGESSTRLAPIAHHITAKHKRSKMELKGPKNPIKVLMDLVSHLWGFFKYSLSTRSNGMPNWEKSQSRFWVNICTGSMGRKGKKTLAKITEIMFPKFPLAAILMYLIMFPKVRRPSMKPSSSTIKSFSNNIISAVSFAISTALSTEIPTSAW